VMAQRIAEGRSPFAPDKNHIHHKLLKLGFDHHEAVMVIYAVQADLFLLAYWLRYESDLTIMAVVIAFFAGSIGLLQSAERHGWRFRGRKDLTKDSPFARLVTKPPEPRYLPGWSYRAVAAGVGGYAVVVSQETAALAIDVQMLVIGLLAITVVLLATRRTQALSLLDKAALYVTSVVVVYVDAVAQPQHLALLGWLAIAVAAIGTALRLRLSTDRRFVLTPLDLIVLFVALVVPSLSGSFAIPHAGTTGIAKLMVLFYAIEVLISRVEQGALWLRIGAAAILITLTLRPLLSF
jgi:UDP-GlcNAc:undecaprenyl-phosphate/decaprenyl-phosphate GlcNAc-1-phosphate transferase